MRSRGSQLLLVLTIVALAATLVVHVSPWVTKGFGYSYDGYNGAMWSLGARGAVDDPIGNRLGGIQPSGYRYANHPPLLVWTTAVTGGLTGERPVALRAPALLASLVALVLLAALLRDAGFDPVEIAGGLAVAGTSAMFLTFGAMLDTPVLSLPFGLAALWTAQRAWQGRPPPGPVLPVGWALHARSDDAAINEVDVGFAQDMIIHHDQAVQMALEIVGDQTVDPAIRTAAQEIVIFQRYEVGLLNDSLARWDEPVETKEAMGWMGTPMAPSDMPGLATTAQMERLSAASGEDKAAIFLALMTRHHQGGAAMAGAAAANGRDTITRGVARAMNRNQLAEIVEYEQLRKRLGLAIPKGLEPLPNAALTGHAAMSMDD